MDQIKEGEGTLLDHTTVVMGSNFGDASNHTCNNLPMIVAGGGYRHGQIIGSTNSKAEFPTTRKIGVEDFCAIFYHALGLKATDSIVDPSGRPMHLLPSGEVPRELL